MLDIPTNIFQLEKNISKARKDIFANKRICIPEGFLAIDAILIIYANITSNIVVYENVIKKLYSKKL